MSAPLLDLRHVSRTFDGSETKAVDDLSLTIDHGEFVAIVGQSGAGKSTLLNVLGLLDTPSSGEYLVNGQDPRALDEAERDRLRAETFGFVFQDSFVLPSESVARNVALPLRMSGSSQDEQLRVVEAALARFGLLGKAEQRAGNLSGGERQRVAFARAIAGAPLVLLADEPTGNLDSRNSARVMSSLQELHRSGVTVVVITHSEDVAAVAERRVLISDGRVLSDRTGRAGAAGVVPGAGAEARSKAQVAVPRADSSDAPRRRKQWHLAEALTSLLLVPARSFTLLGAFVVAVAGLIAAVNMTATAAHQVSATLAAAALDEVIVHGSSFEQLDSDATKIRALDGVLAVATDIRVEAPEAHLSRPIASGLIEADARVRVVGSEFFELNEVEVSPAHAVDVMAAADGAPAAILGTSTAEQLGLSAERVGEMIVVNSQRVVVAGFITSAGRDVTLSSAVLVSTADFVVPPGATASILVRTEDGLPATIAEVLPLAVDPIHPERVKVETVADLRELTLGVNSDLAVNISIISAVLLVLVCLTSSISMSLTVLARTREIALRRAVGASRGDVRRMFVYEGAILGLAGGVAGCSLGVVATTLVCIVLAWSPSFDPLGAVIGLSASVLAGVASAIVPAWRAARVEPSLALRAH